MKIDYMEWTIRITQEELKRKTFRRSCKAPQRSKRVWADHAWSLTPILTGILTPALIIAK